MGNMLNGMKKLSIIIPVYNEEQILEKELGEIMAEMKELLPDLDYEILVVENGSFDNTPQILKKISENNSSVRVLSLPTPSYGNAFKEGILNANAHFLAVFNIDFWNIEFVKKTLPFLEKDVDVVVASKTMQGSKDSRPFLRRFITKSFNTFLRLFFGFKGTDTHGIKIFNKDNIIPVLKQCRTNKEIFDTELLIRAQKAGLLIKELPIDCEEKRKTPSNLLKRVPRTLKELFILWISLDKKAKDRQIIFLVAVLIFINIFSFSTLTTKPALWFDEGINIELARNFSEFGKLDLVVEPSTFSGWGANIGSTGYAITLPLALFFKIFGFGFAQARIYMLIWMNIFILLLFYFVKKQWNTNVAVITTLLVTTFPAFYALGRTVMGEIPGFVFLLLTLIWYLHKRNLFVSGIFLGLAVISKPSVYVFFIPAFVILFLLNKKEFFKKTLKLGFGAFIPFLVWILIYLPAVSSGSTWKDLKEHFINPYSEEGMTVWGNITNNLALFFYSPTLIYFSVFTLIIVLALCLNKDFYKKNRNLFLLSGIYGLFALFYFLKSFGYYRYLIAVQFLIFIFLAPTGICLSRYFSNRKHRRPAVVIFFGVLVLFQGIYLLAGAKLFYSNETQETVEYVKNNFAGSMIGVINLPTVACAIPAENKYQTISTYGLRDLGPHPLSFEEKKLPMVVILDGGHNLEEKYENQLKEFYKLNEVFGRIMIYELLF